MLDIGKVNTLKIVKAVDFGLYLDGGDDGEILLPQRYVPEEYVIGEDLDVFIYCDSEDRLIATTETPNAQVDEFAYLRAVSVTKIGAFLDWGLLKDLFVPKKEQRRPMEEGESYLVRVYLDASRRIAASSKLGRYLTKPTDELEAGQEVDLLVWTQTALGYNVIVNEAQLGLIFNSEVFQKLSPGDTLKGFIKNVRPDGKLDIGLPTKRPETVGSVSDDIMAILEKEGGFVPLNDKSSPAVITETFGVSKKTFKQALGSLYKKRAITIDSDGIRIAR